MNEKRQRGKARALQEKTLTRIALLCFSGDLFTILCMQFSMNNREVFTRIMEQVMLLKGLTKQDMVPGFEDQMFSMFTQYCYVAFVIILVLHSFMYLSLKAHKMYAWHYAKSLSVVGGIGCALGAVDVILNQHWNLLSIMVASIAYLNAAKLMWGKSGPPDLFVLKNGKA